MPDEELIEEHVNVYQYMPINQFLAHAMNVKGYTSEDAYRTWCWAMQSDSVQKLLMKGETYIKVRFLLQGLCHISGLFIVLCNNTSNRATNSQDLHLHKDRQTLTSYSESLRMFASNIRTETYFSNVQGPVEHL